MTEQQYFEFEAELDDGRVIYVEGYADVEQGCDCASESHAHISDIEFVQMVQMFESGTTDASDVTRSRKVRAELEDLVLEHVYGQLDVA